MSTAQIEVQLIAMVVAAAAALPGVFLVLRRMAMMSDAISHSILIGIVLAFFVVHNLSHPLLVFGAAATGVLTVVLVELLNRTKRVHADSAIGLVFPLLFSIGVILISRYASHVHLDLDAVLMGELAFAPFDRLTLMGLDFGPRALWLMGGILLLNLLFIILFFKELKLATFDPGLAAALGFSPVLLHYGLMTVVSVTAVGAFEAVGSLLVVALMIAPPATAWLLTDRLSRMLTLSVLFGVLSALSGYWLAHLLDVSIAGMMATMTGFFFLAVFLYAPRRGILAIARRRAYQRISFAGAALAVHLLNHENLPEAMEECRVDHLGEHLRWEEPFAKKVIRHLVRADAIRYDKEYLQLTPKGRLLAQTVMER